MEEQEKDRIMYTITQSMKIIEWLVYFDFTLREATNILIDLESCNSFGDALLNAINNKEDHDHKSSNIDWGNPITP